MAARLNSLKAVDTNPELIEVARNIANERREKLLALCEAVLEHEYESAETLARELSGKLEASHRTNQGQHSRTSRRG